MKRSVFGKGQNWYQRDNFSISLPHISLQLESKRKDNENLNQCQKFGKKSYLGQAAK